MVLAHYQNVLQQPDGVVVNIVQDGLIELFEPGTTDALNVTAFADAEGTIPLTNPFPAAADGSFEFFLTRPQYVKIVATGLGVGETTFDYQAVIPDFENFFIFSTDGWTVNIRSFEETPDTVGVNGHTTADSDALDAAILFIKQYTQAMRDINDDGRPPTLLAPPGHYNLSRVVDLDGLVCWTLKGGGVENTIFGVAVNAESTVAYWDDKSMFTSVGTTFTRLEGFSITPANGASSPCPEAGFIMATNDPYTNYMGDAQGSNLSNFNEMYSVRIRGAFQKAGMVTIGLVSSIFENCEFARDKPVNTTYRDTVGVTIDEASLAVMRDNAIGITKCGSVDFYTGSDPQNSDITWRRIEIHDYCRGGVANATPNSCTCPCLWIQEGKDQLFDGGNWIGGAKGTSPTTGDGVCGYLRMDMATSTGTVTGCRNLEFANIGAHQEEGIETPDIFMRLTSNHANNALVSRFRIEYYTTDDTDVINEPGPSIVASDINIHDCNIACNNAVINGGRKQAGGSTVANFYRWKFKNNLVKNDADEAFQMKLMTFGASDKGLFVDCEFDFMGMDYDTGTGGPSPVRGVFYYPGSPSPDFGTAIVHFGRTSDTAGLNLRNLQTGSAHQELAMVSGVAAWFNGAKQLLDATGAMLYASSANTLAKLAIGSTGNVIAVVAGIPTWVSNMLMGDGSASTPSYGFSGQAGVGVYRSATNTLAFATSSTNQIQLDSAGALLLKSLSGTPSQNGAYHQMIAKGIVYFDVTNVGSPGLAVNINSISDATGNWTVSWERDFSSVDYAVIALANAAWDSSTGSLRHVQEHNAGRTAGASQILSMRADTAALADPLFVSVVAYGVQ